jgi:hypothetical protein
MGGGRSPHRRLIANNKKNLSRGKRLGSIPYKVTSEISGTFPFPFQFYDAVWDVLIGMDGLALCLQFYFADLEAQASEGHDPWPNRPPVYFIFKHIIFRTIQFRKIVEFIRIKEIIEGKPTIGIAGAPFKERTIEAALKYLVETDETDILLKINLPKNKVVTPMYGLNLPVFLSFLNVTWKQEIQKISDKYDEESKCNAKSAKSYRAQKILLALNEYLERYKPMFNFIERYNYLKEIKGIKNNKCTIENVESFCDELYNICQSGNNNFDDYDLIEAIRNSRIRKKLKDFEETVFT